MDREYRGCIYDRPTHQKKTPLDLTWDEVGHLVEQLPHKPMVLDHHLDQYAGAVTKAWQDPKTGSAWIDFVLDPKSDHGREAFHRIKHRRVRGLSLSHYRDDLIPREVSIVEHGCRRNTGIINASINSQVPTDIPVNVRIVPAPAMADPVAAVPMDTSDSTESKTGGLKKEEDAKDKEAQQLLDQLLGPVDPPASSAPSAASTQGVTGMDVDAATMQQFQKFQEWQRQQASGSSLDNQPQRGTKRPAEDTGLDSQTSAQVRELMEKNAQLEKKAAEASTQLMNSKFSTLIKRWSASGMVDPKTTKGRDAIANVIKQAQMHPDPVGFVTSLLNATVKRTRTDIVTSATSKAEVSAAPQQPSTEQRAAQLASVRGNHNLPPRPGQSSVSNAQSMAPIQRMVPLSDGKQVLVNASYEEGMRAKGYDHNVAAALANLKTYEPHTGSYAKPMNDKQSIWSMDAHLGSVLAR